MCRKSVGGNEAAEVLGKLCCCFVITVDIGVSHNAVQ
jgi:hypothetical protein